ncbi:hypothetical protein [Cellulosilyticum lentocellum]|uniref:Copper amine oxidase-like domain-containing protein n=1 Tax=Cellulosilyticum lentocellum (strain ATCC 49066 / DSM 5427 / NCIMB 11756 / RHM5) TaxID=642492 RepID=F2JN61_CELLD|nr:hypothetical protein [Cellulosilyticum lentocellum]ADZ82403.1 hypothetical protein Clole_0669 [Cellulosilyticum lentocellum DSM 5427]
MKKKHFIAVGIIALSLCFSLGAATGIKIQAELMNQKMNINGKEQVKETISYKGKTYVPLRDLGNMLNVPVDYKNGIVYVGKEELVDEWIEVDDEDGLEYTTMWENKKLNAICLTTIGEVYPDAPLTAKGQLEALIVNENDKGSMKINKSSIEKIGDKEIIYIEAEISDTPIIAGYQVYDSGSVYTVIMLKQDDSNPSGLKDELMRILGD